MMTSTGASLPRVYLPVVFILAASLRLSAVEPLYLNDTAEVYHLGKYCEYFEDTSEQITVAELAAGAYDERFSRSREQVFGCHAAGSNYWIRFAVHNKATPRRQWMLDAGYSIIGLFDLYISEDGKQFIAAGDPHERLYLKRIVDYESLLFDLTIPPGETRYIYMKVNSQMPMIFNLSLMSADKFVGKSTKLQYILGIYYGLVLMLFIYSLFNFIALRNPTYIWYGLYILFIALMVFSIDGKLGRYLAIGSDLVNIRIVNILMILAMFSGISYAQRFLDMAVLNYRYHKILRMTKYVLAGLLALALAGPIPAVVISSDFLPFPILTMMIIAGALSVVKGHKPARLYLMGFGAFAIGGAISNMGFIGALPANAFTYYAIHAGSALEAIFLVFALSQQMSLLKREKEQAQEKALAVLEQKVQERTVEIRKQKELIEEKNKDITDSIRYAQRIQAAILPKEEAIAKAFSDHFVLFKPRDIVSGDFYWFAQRDGKILIAACDCTGHGVPGAFVSMIGNDLLNQTVVENGITGTGAVLSHVSRGIKSAFTTGEAQEAQDGMDMTLCAFDFKTMKMAFSGANNPLLMIRNKEMEQIRGDKTPIGGDTSMDYEFETHELNISHGDVCYIFSDGFQDQFGGPRGKKFMIKKLKELLLEHHVKPFAEQKLILEQALHDWMGKLDQVDDVLVIGVKL